MTADPETRLAGAQLMRLRTRDDFMVMVEDMETLAKEIGDRPENTQEDLDQVQELLLIIGQLRATALEKVRPYFPQAMPAVKETPE
jgi:hypothetical protein